MGEQLPVESCFAVRHTLPNEQDSRFNRSTPTQVHFLRFALRHTPPINRTPFRPYTVEPKSVSSIFVVRQTLPDEQDPVSTVCGRTEGPFPPFCGTPDLISAVPSKPVGSHAFRCLPMNTTHSVASP